MKFLVVAVGHKMPDWITTGFQEYAKRMPREAKIELLEIKPEPRTTGKNVAGITGISNPTLFRLPIQRRNVVLRD